MNNLNKKAFTLIEIIIAISIMSLIFYVAYRAVTQIGFAKAEIEDQRDTLQIANTILTRFARELQLVSDYQQLEDPSLEGYYFFGSDERISGDRDGDQITFLAEDGGQYVPDGQTHSGLVMISYRVVRNPERTKSGAEETFVLIRDEVPNTKPYEKALEKRMTFPITDKLVSLNFEFFDHSARSWQNDWKEKFQDKAINKVPGMIRIKIRIMTNSGKIMTFATAIAIKAGVKFGRT